MTRNRDRNKTSRARKENTREEKKGTRDKTLLTFSFRHFQLDHQLDTKIKETDLQKWIQSGKIPDLFNRLKELSKLSRDEAVNSNQITIYGDFPDKKISEYQKPPEITDEVSWAVIKNIGGKPRIAGYIIENTFYVVFLDLEHQFWKSEKKHT